MRCSCVLVLIWGVLLGGTAGGAEPESTPIPAVTVPIVQAWSLYQAGEPDQAIELLRPFGWRDSQARFAIGWYELMAGRPTRARTWLAHSLKDGDPQGRTRYLLVLAELQSGRLRRAVSLARELVEQFPEDPYSRILLGDGLRQLHRFNQALEEYQLALDLAPELPGGWIGAGWAELALGRYGSAEERFEAARERFPESLEVALGLKAARTDWNGEAGLYGTWADYSDHPGKRVAAVGTTTVRLGWRDRLDFELGYARAEVDWAQDWPEIQQDEYRLSLGGRIVPSWRLEGSGVWIESSDALTDQGWVLSLEVQRIRPLGLAAGIAVSNYQDGLVANQGSARTWTSLRGGWGSETHLTGGWTDGPGALDLGRWLSLEQRIGWSGSRWGASGAIWVGRRHYPVEYNGRVVYNVTDVLRGGLEVSGWVRLGGGLSLVGTVRRLELESSGKHSDQFLATLGSKIVF